MARRRTFGGVLAGFVLCFTMLCCSGLVLGEGPNDFAGTWVYSLGPNVLLALRLEPVAGAKGTQMHGYLLHPEHFNMNSPGGTVLLFSGLKNVSVRDPLLSAGMRDGELVLVDDTPAKPGEKAGDGSEFRVRRLDPSHISFLLFAFLPPFRMEKVATDTPVLASNWDETRTYSQDDFAADNPEMKRIVDADQADRRDALHIDWSVVGKADETRRQATAVLLKEGKLRTGRDFESAAFVFQHGSGPDDYLLAHALAVVAVSKGQRGAVWISAATLDRYLQSVHQPQVFGTQFSTPDKQPTTQEPYNRALISDALRGQMGVPTEAAQDQQRHTYDTERGVAH